MSKRVTSQEKQLRLLNHFKNHPEPFLLKELEKIGPKLYGIVEKTVKV
jgi:Mnd1 HTH domain